MAEKTKSHCKPLLGREMRLLGTYMASGTGSEGKGRLIALLVKEVRLP